MLSSHGREIGTQDALKKESRGLSQVAAGNLRKTLSEYKIKKAFFF